MSLLVTVFCTGSLPAPWGEPGLWLHTGGRGLSPQHWKLDTWGWAPSSTRGHSFKAAWANCAWLCCWQYTHGLRAASLQKLMKN